MVGARLARLRIPALDRSLGMPKGCLGPGSLVTQTRIVEHLENVAQEEGI